MVAMIGTSGNTITPGPGTNPGMSEVGGGGLAGLLGNNPDLFSGLLGAGAGILGGMFGGSKDIPFKDELTGVAGQAGGAAGSLMGTGTALTQGLLTGKLPAGAQALIDQKLKEATNTISGKYAQLGQTGSTMEADALANVQNQASEMQFKIAEDMARTGLQATGQSLQALGIESQVYSNLMQAQMKSDQSMSDTIGKFASSLGSLAAKAAPALLAL